MAQYMYNKFDLDKHFKFKKFNLNTLHLFSISNSQKN